MAGRKRERAGKPDRRVCLQFDRLEHLRLLSVESGVHHSLGAFIAPSVTLPRISQPVQIVDPHVAINNYEAGILGAEIQPIQLSARTHGSGALWIDLSLRPPADE